MPEIEMSSGRVVIFSPCLQIRFFWVTDHWKHEFISDEGCRSIPRIWSVEGISHHEGQKGSSGPLYQHLDARVEPYGVALATLSGRSGPHHFQTTFAVEEGHDGVVINVAVADHCGGPIEDLAVTFLIEASAGKLVAADNRATVDWHHPDCRLVFEADPPAKVSASEAGLGTIRLRAHASPDPSENDRRFHYRWRWISHPARQIWDREA